MSLALCLILSGCGRKGDPVPRHRAAPRACSTRWVRHRVLEVTLPSRDERDEALVGVERVRLYFLPLGPARPTALEVLARGEVILERRRPDVPESGRALRLDLKEIGRPAGWIVVAAIRVGDVLGVPSDPLPWLDPGI
jgi:hypothetical protein